MDVSNLREPVSALSHALGLALALPGTWLLWRRAAGDRARQLSLLVFGTSLVACYGASACFHGVRLTEGERAAFATADSVGIFALIAGSVTPIAWTLMRGRWRRNALVLTWGVAALGASWSLLLGTPPLPIATGLYLGMGWGAVVCYVEIARRITHRALWPIPLGGVCYSVGAALNLLKWPDIWPGTIGPHELFHVFVMAGSACHYWFMLTVVAPFRDHRIASCPLVTP